MTWQPIATAPKDKPILVTDGHVAVAVEIQVWKYGSRTGLDLVGIYACDYEFMFDFKDLTHWMEIPKLPVKGDRL